MLLLGHTFEFLGRKLTVANEGHDGIHISTKPKSHASYSIVLSECPRYRYHQRHTLYAWVLVEAYMGLLGAPRDYR